MERTTAFANEQPAGRVLRRQSSLHAASASFDSNKISDSEEIVFQRMAYRKLERQMRGTYKSDKPWTILWTFLTLLLLFGVIAPNFVDIGGEDEESPSKKSFDIQINIRDLGFFSLMAVITLFTLVYTLTRVVVVVRWSLYWLLATLSILYLWKRQINLFSNDTPAILLIGFGVLEFLTFFVYILMNFIYPPFIKSEFFRKNIGVTWWFGIKKQARLHWTLTYSSGSWVQGRRTCTYRGETDADGLPHGFGNWLDDSFHGELLSGLWERGKPIGPFRSREFGSGFAFESLRIGYVHCSDDTFSSRNFFPSQQRIPTIGVASVECSVAGGFFSHLPRAEVLVGPFCLASALDFEPLSNDLELGERRSSSQQHLFDNAVPHYPLRRISDILPSLEVLYTEHPSSSLIITATRGRGVLVSGHSFIGNGQTVAIDHGLEPEQLVIDVVRGEAVLATSAASNSSTSSASSSSSQVLQSGIQAEIRIDPVETQEATDAIGTSLVLPDEDMRDDDEEMNDFGVTSTDNRREVRFYSLQGSQQAAEETFHTPLLTADDEMNTRDEEPELDDYLFFNLANIPAATFHNQLLQQQMHLVQRPHSEVLQNSRMLMSQTRSLSSSSIPLNQHQASAGVNSQPESSRSEQQQRRSNLGPGVGPVPGPYLRVRGWKSTVDGHMEALILFPGFNASLEHSLERMGQFMAMGRFPPHIKPLVFSWPCAREATYLWAAEMAQSSKTHRALAALLTDLEQSGVRDVHFLVHSLGAQVVCSALRDDPETLERSQVSKLFANATSVSGASPGGNLRLRTLTLLNPDTPLSSFIHRDFPCLRRVCDHITVVGDKKDGALHWSELGNGVVRTLKGLGELFFKAGSITASALCSSRPWSMCCRSCVDGCCRPYRHGVDRLFSRVLTLGRNIFSLYIRSGNSSSDDGPSSSETRPLPQRIFHRGLAAVTFASTKDGRYMTDEDEASFDLLEEETQVGSPNKKRRNRRWLDVDVIDTSSMETNVHQLRHAYFDLNKILVEDLHELIVTGRRAAERSLLLHREGNIFSFCQAPACVVNK